MKPILYGLLSWGFHLFCLVCVNWWAPIFADRGGWLPNWLAWVQTFDDTLDAGLRDGIYSSKIPRYIGRVLWLYRNTGYGFNYWFLGVPFVPSTWRVVEFNPDPNKFTFRALGPNGQFNTHIVRGPIRLKLGWKAMNMYDQTTGEWKTKPWGPVWRIPFTLSVSRARKVM